MVNTDKNIKLSIRLQHYVYSLVNSKELSPVAGNKTRFYSEIMRSCPQPFASYFTVSFKFRHFKRRLHAFRYALKMLLHRSHYFFIIKTCWCSLLMCTKLLNVDIYVCLYYIGLEYWILHERDEIHFFLGL